MILVSLYEISFRKRLTLFIIKNSNEIMIEIRYWRDTISQSILINPIQAHCTRSALKHETCTQLHKFDIAYLR